MNVIKLREKIWMSFRGNRWQKTWLLQITVVVVSKAILLEHKKKISLF